MPGHAASCLPPCFTLPYACCLLRCLGGATRGAEPVFPQSRRSQPPCLFRCPAGWVSKKVGELLGEEPSFCRFIMEQLGGHVSAEAMLGALADVLDEDAEPFTLKLWQILIYEQLKLERA